MTSRRGRGTVSSGTKDYKDVYNVRGQKCLEKGFYTVWALISCIGRVSPTGIQRKVWLQPQVVLPRVIPGGPQADPVFPADDAYVALHHAAHLLWVVRTTSNA